MACVEEIDWNEMAGLTNNFCFPNIGEQCSVVQVEMEYNIGLGEVFVWVMFRE